MVPLSLSQSCVTRKKNGRANSWGREARERRDYVSRASLLQEFARPFFSRGFLSLHARQSSLWRHCQRRNTHFSSQVTVTVKQKKQQKLASKLTASFLVHFEELLLVLFRCTVNNFLAKSSKQTLLYDTHLVKIQWQKSYKWQRRWGNLSLTSDRSSPRRVQPEQNPWNTEI